MSINVKSSVWYEKVAMEFLKYDSSLFAGTNNRKTMKQMLKARAEIAKTLKLPDDAAVNKNISDMMIYVKEKTRDCVRQCIADGTDAQDALNYAPPWFKLLDERLNLSQLASNLEILHSLELYNTDNRVGHFTAKIVRGVCRAAARELRRDHVNGGAGQLPEDRKTRKEDSTKGKVSEPRRPDSNIGRASELTSCTGAGRGRVSDSKEDGASGAHRATMVLVSEDAVQEYAKTVNMRVSSLHWLWIRIYSQSIHKLTSLIAAGDQTKEDYAPIDWLAADAGLLYDTRLPVLRDKTFQSSVTLNPLILLYKLVVAAHEKINELKLNKLPNFTLNEDRNTDGAQCGTKKNLNVPSCAMDVKENVSSEMKVDRDKTDEINRARDKCIWALVHSNYISSGRKASAVLLQRRWYDMKHRTKELLGGQGTPVAPPPILLALAKRFPSVLTEKLPPWTNLVRDHLVYQDSELEPTKRVHSVCLEVHKEIGENLIFDDLNDWSDDEGEVVDENRETLTLPYTNDGRTDEETDNQTEIKDNIHEQTDVNTNNIKTELSDNDTFKKLKNIDPTKAKVRIIFEDDSDDDINDFINGANEPNTSKNTNAVSNALKASNFNCTEEVSDLDEKDTKQSVLTDNKELVKVTDGTELINEVIEEVKQIKEEPSVSNEVETEVGPNNQNFDIDMAEVVSDLRDTDEVTETEDKLQNDLSSEMKIKFDTIDDYLIDVSDDSKHSLIVDKRSYDDDKLRPETVGNMELIKMWPCSVQLKRLPRVMKKIELQDIDEIRRVNSTILTAEVSPITLASNKVYSIGPPTKPEPIQESSRNSGADDEIPLGHLFETNETKLPLPLTVEQENIREHLPQKREKLSESDIKKMIKAIVRKGDLPKVQDTAPVAAKRPCFNYLRKQKKLERDLSDLSKVFFLHIRDAIHVDSPGRLSPTLEITEGQPSQQEKKKKMNSRRKDNQENLLNFYKSNKQVKQYTNKKKISVEGKANTNNAGGSSGGGNKATQNGRVYEATDSSGNNERVIKRKIKGVSDATVKRPKIQNEDGSASVLVIEVSDDSDDGLKETAPNTTDCAKNARKRTRRLDTKEDTIKVNKSGRKIIIVKRKNTKSTSILEQPLKKGRKKTITASQKNDTEIVQNSNNTATNTNAQDTNTNVNSIPESNSMYYMINLPNNISGSNTTLISPLPEICPIPVIQSVTPLIQRPPQTLNQMCPSVISVNQDYKNVIPVYYLNHTTPDQIPNTINLSQPIPNQDSLNQHNLNQPNLNQPNLHQPKLNQPNLNQPNLNQPNLNQPNLNQPNLHQPKLNQPNLNQPNLNQPNLNQPNLNQPNLHQPKLNQPNLNQPNLNQPNLNQPNLNQPNLNQPNLNQPNLNQPNLNQPNLNQPIQNQIPQYPNQVVAVNKIEYQVTQQTVSLNQTIVSHNFETFTKNSYTDDIPDTNSISWETTQMPVIQSVCSLREVDQKNDGSYELFH